MSVGSHGWNTLKYYQARSRGDAEMRTPRPPQYNQFREMKEQCCENYSRKSCYVPNLYHLKFDWQYIASGPFWMPETLSDHFLRNAVWAFSQRAFFRSDITQTYSAGASCLRAFSITGFAYQIVPLRLLPHKFWAGYRPEYHRIKASRI